LPLESAAIAPRPDATLSFAASAVPSYHEKLALIRRHYRRQTFADNASDLLALRSVFDSLAIATAAAQGAIATALEIARSRGGAGELVDTSAMLQSNFSSGGEAQAWEALTFTKLRFLAGDKRLGEQVSAQTANSLGRLARSEDSLPKVLDMRQRPVQTGSGS